MTFIDPCIVDAPCCHTVSREAAVQWFEISRHEHFVCPCCGVNLRSLSLTPNTCARDLIAMYEYTILKAEHAKNTLQSSGDNPNSKMKKKKKTSSGLLGKVFRRKNIGNKQTMDKILQPDRTNGEEVAEEKVDIATELQNMTVNKRWIFFLVFLRFKKL